MTSKRCFRSLCTLWGRKKIFNDVTISREKRFPLSPIGKVLKIQGCHWNILIYSRSTSRHLRSTDQTAESVGGVGWLQQQKKNVQKAESFWWESETWKKNLNFKTSEKKSLKDQSIFFFCYSSLNIETIRYTYTHSHSHRQTPGKGCFSFWVF